MSELVPRYAESSAVWLVVKETASTGRRAFLLPARANAKWTGNRDRAGRLSREKAEWYVADEIASRRNDQIHRYTVYMEMAPEFDGTATESK